MWIEELLEHDRPISIHFRDIQKTDASGSIRPSASTAGLTKNFFILNVFEINESIFRCFLKLPCPSGLEKPGQLPVSEVL